LKESGVDFDAVDYYVEPLSSAQLKSLLKKMRISASELIRRKEAVYKDLKIAEKSLSEDELVNLMAKHPDLIQRPIVERGATAILARPADLIKDFLKF